MGIKELLVIAVIVLLLFGTKKLRGIGSDLGNAIKGFKKEMEDETPSDKQDEKKSDTSSARNHQDKE